jgi:transcriptional regulator
MHPNRKFHIASRQDMAEIVTRIGFGVLVVQTEQGLRAVHLPVLLDQDRLLFHVSRGNLVHEALTRECEALCIVNGPHAYVSPDWYGLDDRVPTWSYVAIEMEGRVRPIGTDALVRLLDDMSDTHEERLLPKKVWKRGMMTPGRFEGMLKAISGFEMTVVQWRGTAKIDQDKPEEVRLRLADRLAQQGEAEMARIVGSGSAL